jgi:hypothetical protein
MRPDYKCVTYTLEPQWWFSIVLCQGTSLLYSVEYQAVHRVQKPSNPNYCVLILDLRLYYIVLTVFYHSL